jgi:hypothetical protein
MADTQYPGTLFPTVGFEVSSTTGSPNNYTTSDTYGFDQNELNMGIRIKALTGINPMRDDADWALNAIKDNDLMLAGQNTLITNYMMNKYVSV